MNWLISQFPVHIYLTLSSWVLPSMALVEFPARKHSLQNEVVLVVYNEWHNMNVSVDRDQEHPLSRTFGMFDYIYVLFLQNQQRNILERDPSFFLEPGTFVLVPYDVHDSNISHNIHNVKQLGLVQPA